LSFRSSASAVQLPDGKEPWIVMFKKVLQPAAAARLLHASYSLSAADDGP
jgi:hypothetical protein